MALETGDVTSTEGTTGVGATGDTNNVSAADAEQMKAASGAVTQPQLQRSANEMSNGLDTTNGGNQVMAQATILAPRIGPMMGPRSLPNAGEILGTNRPTVPNVLENRRLEDKALHKGKQDGEGMPDGDRNNPDLKGRNRRDAIEDGKDWAIKERKMEERRGMQRFQEQLRRFREWLIAPPQTNGDLIA